MEADDKQPFTSHLEELRHRLVVSFIAVIAGFVLCFFFKEFLFDILVHPLMKVMRPEAGVLAGDETIPSGVLIYTGLTEAFFTYLKAAFIAGILLASPVVIYEFWMFVAPGLYGKERRLLAPIIALSSLFFVGGALFGYFVVFPWGFKFFLGFATETIRPLPSMKEYLSLSTKMLLAFGLVFELPLVITFLARLGLVGVPFLKKNRKYALLLFFAGAAMLTPPDVVTQVMMALPLIVLYEISILGARLFGRKKPGEAAEAAEGSETAGQSP